MKQNEPEIKLGYCIAYDWEMLKTSLPLIYNHVDKVCLSIDKDRLSWSRNPYTFDNEAFFAYVEKIDTNNKIIVYEDDFHIDANNPMANEVYQRNKIAEKLGTNNSWHIQLDVDEYLVGAEHFIKYLKDNAKKFDQEINISLPLLTLFKKTQEGFVMVKSKKPEWIQIASRKPKYERGRRNGYFNFKLDFPLLHQSWARSEHEILQKINNWGHRDDFDTQAFFQLWKNINKKNYSEIKNFHPIEAKEWESLILIEGATIEELIRNKEKINALKAYSKSSIAIDNNRNIARMKGLWSKIFKKK